MSEIDTTPIKNKVIEINNNLSKTNNKTNSKHIKNINQYITTLNKTAEASIPVIKNIHVNKDKLFDKIGILDPEGLQNNPLTGEPYKNIYLEKTGQKYSEFAEGWSTYPMYSQKDEVIDAVYNNQCILITAGTGSGKTVLVPKYTLHALNYEGKIAITIPRKVPTIEAASFAAATLDVTLGEQVGYTVKDDKKVSSTTKLVYATDGYILALMKNDLDLNEFDALIIDEAHERGINIDLLLFYSKQILRNRPNFKLIIMSATIDPELFKNYYKEFGLKHIEGKPGSYFNVNEIFLEKSVNRTAPNGEILSSKPKPYIIKVVDIIFNDILKPGKEGDILVLFPAKNDCTDACKMLDEVIAKEKKINKNFVEKPFCIDLNSKSKKKLLKNGSAENYAIGKKPYTNINKGYTRRIVMATDIAESSITFSGAPIDWVIDTGLSNDKRYYPDTELEALECRYIAKANHIQRKGRTGRKREGTCYNVFTKEEYKGFLDYPIAPIMENDITDLLVTFLTYPNISHINVPFKYEKVKVTETESLNVYLTKLIEMPHIDFVNNGIKKLFLLGALKLEDGKAYLTEFGRALTYFRDIDSHKAACIIHSYNYKCSNEVILLMSLLNELEDNVKDIINEPKDKYNSNKSKLFKSKIKKMASSYGDHITLHNILETYKEKTYTIGYEKGRQELVSKGTGDGTLWAKENYINSKKITDAIRKSKDLNNSIGKVIGTYRRNHPEKINDKFIFRDTAPYIHDRRDDNIMQVITLGYINNIAKKIGNKYSTCFPLKSIFADVDRDSLFNYIAIKPIHCVFSKLFSGGGKKRFLTFSKIPIKVMENLNNEEKDIIKKCGKK